MLKVHHISTSCLTHWPTKYTNDVDSQGNNFHQVWSWYDHPLPNYSVLAANTLRDLDLWHFDPEQLSYMVGHMANPATNARNGCFGGNWGSKRYILVSQPPKSTSLRGTTSFNVFCFKISAHVGGSLSQAPQKIAESLYPKGREITHAQKRHP